jgi:predicted RecB family nuclease
VVGLRSSICTISGETAEELAYFRHGSIRTSWGERGQEEGDRPQTWRPGCWNRSSSRNRSCRGNAVSTATLKRGAPFLANARFEDEELSLCFDGLLSADGASRVGGHHYLPVLHNQGEKVSRRQRIVLAVFGLALARIQGLRPATGLIVRSLKAAAGKIRLDEKLYWQAEQILAELKRLQDSNELPRLTLNAHCQVCEFRRRCLTEATSKDDRKVQAGNGRLALCEVSPDLREILDDTRLSDLLAIYSTEQEALQSFA